MEEKTIKAVMKILSEWNPLGELAVTVPDLDGYRTEAIDILCEIELRTGRSNVSNIVREVLNQAFDLSLSPNECKEPAKRIWAIAKNNTKC
jgi:Domain of unknown function (DUF1871)